jgi:hypothetical protein
MILEHMMGATIITSMGENLHLERFGLDLGKGREQGRVWAKIRAGARKYRFMGERY